jgi:hypothetical protein
VGNIALMERSTLARILDAAEGIAGTKQSYQVSDSHRVSFYLGQAGQAMEIADVDRCELHEDYLVLHRRDNKGTVYIEYGAVYGLSNKALRDGEARRTGFS